MSDTARGPSKKRENPSLGQWLYRRRRLVLYLLSFVLIVAVQTLLYWWGMRTFEGEPRTLLESFNIVIQSLTTTGYGQDAPWNSRIMSLFVVVAQFTGVAYIFIAFPLFIVPWMKDLIVEPSVPETIEEITDHVVLSGYTPLFAALIDDLEMRDQPYVIIEGDRERARSLYEDGHTTIVGDAADAETLRDANVQHAGALVVDATIADDIGTTLVAHGLVSDLEIICLVEDPGESRYLRYAGATKVLSPKHRLGKSVADMNRNVVPVGFDGVGIVAREIGVGELPVSEESDIYGRRLVEVDELREMGATLLGAWVRGEFSTTFSPEGRVDESTVLAVAGTESQLEEVAALARTETKTPRSGPVVTVGHGIVGLTAEGLLRKVDRPVTVVGTEEDDGTDVSGDPTSNVTLREAGVAEADTVIVALADDEEAIRSVLVARTTNSDAMIVVATNDARNASEIRKAGADFVLALSKVAARMATLELFDEAVMTLTDRIQFTRTDGTALETTPLDLDAIGQQTDAAVVAVVRDGEVITDPGAEFVVGAEDELVVAGTPEETDEFDELVTSDGGDPE